MSVVLALVACVFALGSTFLIGGSGMATREGDKTGARRLCLYGEIVALVAVLVAFIAGRISV